MDRFSKKTLALLLWKKIKYLQETFKFTNETGWAQVEGHKSKTCVNYGEWHQCKFLMDHFGLWDFIPKEDFTGIGVFPRQPIIDA